MKQREEKRVTFIYKFSGTAVLLLLVTKKKKKNVLSFLGMELPSLYYTDRLSFLPSPNRITLFARGETLFCFLIT